MRNPSEIVIVSALRTPIGLIFNYYKTGKFNGSLATLTASDLTAQLISEILAQTHINPNEISEVVLGQVLTAGQGQNPSRQACLKAKIPVTTPSYIINMLCGSGLKSVAEAYKSIMLDSSLIILAGGQESMSKAPHCINMREGTKLGDIPIVDTLIKDGLTDAMCNIHMGVTAENIAKQWKIDRNTQDKFALQSQVKYNQALGANYFNKEIVPIEIKSKKGSMSVNKDEFPRPDCSLEELAKLRPAFLKAEEGGTVTAGNASGINDGAALVMVMSLARASEFNLKPLVRIVSWAETGVEPSIMGMGPVSAVRKALDKANWAIDEIDLFELNEAFAAQSIAVMRELKLPEHKVNICGGALALGHPIGASGARILVTLIHSLHRLATADNNRTYKGCAALCIGGGMGIAICIETLKH